MIGWAATASAEAVIVADPEEFSGTVPRVFAPSVKVIVPLGVPAPGESGETAALKVTACPNVLCVAEELRTVVADALFTV